MLYPRFVGWREALARSTAPFFLFTSLATLSLSLSVSLCLSAVPRSVYSGLNNFSLVVLAYFSPVDKIQFVCQTDACVPVIGESDDDDELLFFTAQRLFSPSVSVLLFSGSSATSHSLPLGCRGWLLLSPFDASSCSCSSLSSASWWRLSTTNCIWMWAWSREKRERERERKRERKKKAHPSIAVHRVKEESSTRVHYHHRPCRSVIHTRAHACAHGKDFLSLPVRCRRRRLYTNQMYTSSEYMFI